MTLYMYYCPRRSDFLDLRRSAVMADTKILRYFQVRLVCVCVEHAVVAPLDRHVRNAAGHPKVHAPVCRDVDFIFTMS